MASTNLAPQVYGGDEISAIVLDPGSYSTRIGYAGEDAPRYILPSHYGEYESQDSDKMDVDGTNQQDNKIHSKLFNENSLYNPRPGNYEIKPILKDSLIEDWDGAIEQWQWSFDKLAVNFDEQPLLLTEPVWNTKKNKVGSLEAAFEHFKFPAFYTVKNPTSVSFSNGRPNCLVVDIGHDITTVTPVIDGLCLIKSTLKTHYAGKFLSQQLKQAIAKRNVKIESTYKIKSKTASFDIDSVKWEPRKFDFEITKSFDQFQQERVINEMKETLLQVTRNKDILPGGTSSSSNNVTSSQATSQDSKGDTENGTPVPEPQVTVTDGTKTTSVVEAADVADSRYFELPNGLNLEFSKERSTIANSLFRPNEVDGIVEGYEEAENGEFEFKEEHNIKNDYKPIRRVRKDIDESTREEEIKEKISRKEEKSPDYRGVSDLITTVLSLIDVDLKAHVANNIILTGATTLIPGFTDRLQNELVMMNPSLKIRIHAPGNVYERKYASFVGSSVLASLGTFHQLWVSKREYEEVGVDRLLLSRFK